ncbi:HEPN domain-containing protein [Gelria sp. Kuro-4]|uniref:HEPN domain-containing protein n=1 Tax=Gelria sp. Kuro-4 TaxID=2796927 RepID=UPI001BEF5F92|nr:HEPN domain-containing protein [Gelria sp. Kuro-4]BCV25144.1 DNA-binding protein [Gelria sp. Kuro-4]
MSDGRLSEAQKWLKKAKSSLAKAKVGLLFPEILYEDLCFDAQQAAEKALKALFVFQGWPVPRSHDLARLLRKLARHYSLPAQVQEAAILTIYAVTTRYPGTWETVTEEDWQRAVGAAEATVNWAEGIISRE